MVKWEGNVARYRVTFKNAKGKKETRKHQTYDMVVGIENMCRDNGQPAPKVKKERGT